jgi:hypothetical protein
MARPKLVPTNNLCLFPVPSDESPLTLAEHAASQQPTPTIADSPVEKLVRLDAQTPKAVDNVRRLDAQKSNTGRPIGRPAPQFDSTEEGRYPSRISTMRPNVRLDRALMEVVERERNTDYPRYKLRRVIEDSLRLWLRARAQARLDAQTPTGISSGSSGSKEDQDQEKSITTTTTTLGVQPAVVETLPGIAAKVADLPHDSTHSLDTLLAYAWESYNNDEGIKTPDVWAIKAFRTGKFDAVVALWLERVREEAARQEKREAARREREERERAEQERWQREHNDE